MEIFSLQLSLLMALQGGGDVLSVYDSISEAQDVSEVRVFMPSPTEVSYHGSFSERIVFLEENYSLKISVRDFQIIVSVLESFDKNLGRRCQLPKDQLADAVIQVVYADGAVRRYLYVGDEFVDEKTNLCFSSSDSLEKIIGLLDVRP
ncbi:MAG: hypothetical protein ABL934_16770 [Lysobacteraceae bacterium]